MNIQVTISHADGRHTTREFNTEWEDPMSEPLEAIFGNPHIKKPSKLIAVWDDGEVIVWSKRG